MKVYSTYYRNGKLKYVQCSSSIENKPPTSFLVIQILAYTVS